MRDIDFSDLARVQFSHMLEKSRQQFGEEQTQRYGAAFQKTIDRAATFPESGRNRSDYWYVPGITHSVVYTFDKSTVMVEGFIENGRPVDKVLDRADNRRELAKAVLREHGPAAGRRPETPAKGKEKSHEPDR